MKLFSHFKRKQKLQNVLKCKIPSFVANFVSVVNWEDDKQNILYPNKNYGNETQNIFLKNTYTPCITLT